MGGAMNQPSLVSKSPPPVRASKGLLLYEPLCRHCRRLRGGKPGRGPPHRGGQPLLRLRLLHPRRGRHGPRDKKGRGVFHRRPLHGSRRPPSGRGGAPGGQARKGPDGPAQGAGVFKGRPPPGLRGRGHVRPVLPAAGKGPGRGGPPPLRAGSRLGTHYEAPADQGRGGAPSHGSRPGHCRAGPGGHFEGSPPRRDGKGNRRPASVSDAALRRVGHVL